MRIKKYLLLTALLLNSLPTFADLPNTSNPTTFLGPTVHVGYTGHIYDTSAFNVLGELGPKNSRFGGTLGIRVEDDHFFKVTGEYIFQDITYGFLTGTSNEWVQQMAFGAAYEYDLHGERDPRFDVNGYMSYSPSKSLSDATVTFNTSPGVFTTLTENRRVAGAFGAGISPGVSLLLWQGGRGSAHMNFDNVRYDNSYNGKRHAIGLGGTAGLQQVLTNHIDLDTSIAVRAPFNNYQIGLKFVELPNFSDWIFGLNSGYVSGKEGLPNTWNVFASATYREGQCTDEITHRYKDKVIKTYEDPTIRWTEAPAVYMPQVFGVVDNTTP